MAAKKKSVKTVKKTVKKVARKKSVPKKKKSVNKERKLNPKEKSFCENYLLDHNGAQAAIRAGYSKKTAKVKASQLLTIINVQSEIERLSSIVTKKVLITTEDIVNDLIEIKERCMEKVEAKTKTGITVGFVFDSQGANKALNRLGDYTGGFSKKLDHTTKGDKIESTVLYMPNNGRS